MTHYIDKEVLLREIDKLKQNLSASSIVVIEDVIALVESLEVKEVDLEKEIDEWCNKCISDYELEGWVGIAIQNVARHFFELGLKAKQS